MKYIRIYASSDGESHLEEKEMEFSLAEFAPPAPPLYATEYLKVKNLAYIRCPPGWFGDWHPAPERQAMLMLSGKYQVTVSDGETRVLNPGSISVLEDTEGKGHQTRIIGDEEGIVAVVQFESDF